MISTNYIGMRIGKFEIVEFYINYEDEFIEFRLLCGRCGRYTNIKLVKGKISRVHCNNCYLTYRLLPISNYDDIEIVKDTMTIGEYQYKKLRKEYKKSSSDASELEFILSRIEINNEGDT